MKAQILSMLFVLVGAQAFAGTATIKCGLVTIYPELNDNGRTMISYKEGSGHLFSGPKEFTTFGTLEKLNTCDRCYSVEGDFRGVSVSITTKPLNGKLVADYKFVASDADDGESTSTNIPCVLGNQ